MPYNKREEEEEGGGGGGGDRESGACRGEILTRTQIKPPSDLVGIDDRESNFYS